MRGKNLIKNQGGHKNKIKVRYLVVAMGVLLSGLIVRQTVQAVECPDVRVVFARGSGGEQWTDQNYLAYKDSIEEKLQTTTLKYELCLREVRVGKDGEVQIILDLKLLLRLSSQQ